MFITDIVYKVLTPYYVNRGKKNYRKYIGKQKTHGPHRSTEKQFQLINIFAHDMILP